ncbi:MAG: hypothetical protein KAW12_06040 [Candidatus Aminicenantes bacterium]|nr:hypothetical protein [Candidatus Aminicenantes bacterium]
MTAENREIAGPAETGPLPGEPPVESLPAEEPPPVLKTWRNLYLLVLGNLLLWIILFYIFTWIFE